MMSGSNFRTRPPQAFISSYAPRIRTYGNALVAPVQQQTQQTQNLRTTKRGTAIANYAEDAFDDDEFEDSEAPRRPTGLRSRREEPKAQVPDPVQLGKEIDAPVDVQGIWRDWMGKQAKTITERQQQIQCALPLTLIPIRLDIDISPFRPEPALPLPNNARDFGIDETLPAYKQPDPTPAYRLKDTFLWNLHEALMTPDQFARKFVEELDIPPDRRAILIWQISNTIRQQLEDYAGVAMHPLFQSASASHNNVNGPTQPSDPTEANGNNLPPPNITNGKPSVNAAATSIPPSSLDESDINNPDDTYRCIVTLSVNLLNRLYSDRFEWSLLHPPGLAEAFARVTAADLGLNGEWVSAISHAIYEAVLHLKKEVCQKEGVLPGMIPDFGMENEAFPGMEAGWRFDRMELGESWEPRVEILGKEEIERREADREREMRRQRRATAMYSSTADLSRATEAPPEEQTLGRGERSKKKRRFRSLSPLGRGTPDTAQSGYGGGSALNESERQQWRCTHCKVWGQAVWAVRDGPRGPKSLCHNCGFLYERDQKLPPWSKDFFAGEMFQGQQRKRLILKLTQRPGQPDSSSARSRRSRTLSKER